MMRLSLVSTFIVLSIAAFAQKVNRETLLKDVQILSHDSLQGRKVGSREGKIAANYIVARLKKLSLAGFTADYQQKFRMFDRQRKDSVDATNILAVKKGKKDKYIVISAHYDHVGVMNSNVYNGADDNASGTAALLAMAEYFAKVETENGLIFAFFDAEESGLRGARHFVKSSPVDLSKVILNVNMDMVSRNDKNEIYITGTHYYPELRRIVEPVKSATVTVKFGHDDPTIWKGSDNWTQSSDHGPFHLAKIPFLYYGVEDHADYHKPGDDFENIHPDFFFEVVKTIINHVQALDKGLK